MPAVLAQGSVWSFHLHPDLVGLLVAMTAAYVYALRRWGPLFHPRPTDRHVTIRQKLAFAAGIATLWAGLGWPVHDLAENSLYSAHMLQHILIGYVAPPLILLGMPDWMGHVALGRGLVGRIYSQLSRPIPAAVAFNAVLALIHWPLVVEWMVVNPLFHEAIHLGFMAGAFLMWSALYSPVVEVRERLSPPAKMLFLFVMTILPTVPASFLTFGDRTLYPIYESFPRLWGLSARDDMQLAGLLMKVGAGLLLWSMIAVQFFRWANREENSGLPGSAPELGTVPDRPSNHRS